MRTRGLVALTVLLATVGCGPEPADLGEAPELDDGSEWVLVEGVPQVEGYPITLQVDNGQVRGTAACNSYSGTVDLTDSGFEVGELAHTEMGCPDPGVHDSEAAYLEALLAVDRHERPADELVLSGPDVELRFDPVTPPEDAALTGTRWELESLVTGTGPDGAVSSTMAPGWLELDDDGTFAASDGCNELTGRWSLDGERLRVDDVVTTDMACPPYAEQVDHVHDVLLEEPTVDHEGRRLRLHAEERGLEYLAR